MGVSIHLLNQLRKELFKLLEKLMDLYEIIENNFMVL